MILLVLLACFKLYLALQYELDSEEAQYWLWSKHLQLSYYSKPPMIAYANWISVSIFGNNLLAIRLNAVFAGLLISLVSYILAYEIFKDLNTALLSALLSNILPLFLYSSLFFTPDTPLILFWLLSMLFYWKAVQTVNPVWWICFGISIGLGALAKYTIFLIFIPLLLFTAKYYRPVFRSGYFYLSLLISLIIFSPVILWNIHYGGLGLLHLVYLSGVYDPATSSTQVITNVLQFSLGQIGLFLPFHQFRHLFRGYKNATITREEELLILPVICIFIFFLIVSVISQAGVYINWTMFAYTGLPLLFSHYMVKANQLKRLKAIFALIVLSYALFFFLISPSNRLFPLGNINPVNKRTGWALLASKVDSIKATLPAQECYVFSTNYHISSELAFYLAGQPPTYCLNLHSRMTQFDLWPGIDQFINDPRMALLVERDRISPEIKAGFSTLVKQDSVFIYNQNRCISTFYIYVLKGMKGFKNQPSSY